jgi:predicted GNAT superfamily acetyltransferase
MSSSREEITIRALNADHEMRDCHDLQQRVWGSSELEVVPHHIFVVAQRTGGQVLGAFDQDRMVGFLLAFPAMHEGRSYLHSHMTAVLPDHQGSGIGKKLKLAQREDALQRGFDLIEWTFDPLQLGNAKFNIVHLGAVVREYVPNVYGSTTSQLDSGLPTDRLVAEWWIRHPRVQEILTGNQPQLSGDIRRVRLPRRIREICAADPTGARQIQRQLRLDFERFFDSSFAATAFELDAEYATYILEPYENRDDHAARTSHASQDTL